MNFLPRGVTGFRYYKAPSLCCVPFKKFTELIYVVAQRMNARVISLQPDGGSECANFYTATLATECGKIFILCNAHYPFMAAAEQIEFMNIAFVFLQELILTVEEWRDEFVVIPIEVLQAMPTPQLLSELGSEELHQYNYWKPKRAGDIIFNFWD